MAKKNTEAAADARISAYKKASKRCVLTSLLLTVFIILMLYIISDFEATLNVWQLSVAGIVVGAISVAASLVYFIITVKRRDGKDAVFTPGFLLMASSLFLTWVILFRLFANRFSPVFIAFNICYIILIFIRTYLGKNAFVFSLFTVLCGITIWFFRIFELPSLGARGVSAYIISGAAAAAFTVFVILTSKKTRGQENAEKENEKKKTALLDPPAAIWPFPVTLGIFLASLALSFFFSGYEIYLISVMAVWLIAFGIIKSIQIIGE